MSGEAAKYCNQREVIVFSKNTSTMGRAVQRFQKWSFVAMRKSIFLCDAFIEQVQLTRTE